MPLIGGQHLLWPPFRPLADQFGHEFFRALPESPGVYLLCGEGDGVLYVGKARNLRQRLSSHRSTSTESISRKQRRLLQSVRRIYWDLCPDEAAADQRERELIRTLQPRFNSVGVRPAAPRYLEWRVEGTDLEVTLRPETGREAHPGPLQGGGARIGPFAGMHSVWGALLRLMWWKTHPEAGVHDLPRELRAERPPGRWRFACNREVREEWECSVRGWRTGMPIDLIDGLARSLHLAIPEPRGCGQRPSAPPRLSVPSVGEGGEFPREVERAVPEGGRSAFGLPSDGDASLGHLVPSNLFLRRWQESDLERLVDYAWSPGKAWKAIEPGGGG